MYHYKANYRSNYDGDTIRFDIDLGFGCWLKNQIVRLYGIDTPELRGETIEEGREAKNFVQTVLENATDIDIRTYKDSKGKYGRWLAEVYYDGVYLNKELLDQRLAVKYQYANRR